MEKKNQMNEKVIIKENKDNNLKFRDGITIKRNNLIPNDDMSVKRNNLNVNESVDTEENIEYFTE